MSVPPGRKPEFFIVGAPKAGTSSPYAYLARHPGVFVSGPKEPRFFHNRRSLASSVLEGYLRLFEGVRAGEGSTSYPWSANAP